MKDNNYHQMAKRRVVFLDIDGPIVSLRSTLAKLPSDPISVDAINNFLKIPDTYVVMASVERVLKKTPEEMQERLFKKYGIEVPIFHEKWRTGDSCKERQKEIQNWMDAYGYKADTDYISIDDDPVNIEGVFQVKADFNGIMTDQLLLLRYLAGTLSYGEYMGWKEFTEKKNNAIN